MTAVAFPLMSANSYMGMAVESVYGTAAASVPIWTPVMDPKVAPNVKWLNDAAFRGSPVNIYDTQAGVFAAEYTCKTYVYSDVFPNLLRAALGSTDSVGASVSVSGTGGTSTAYPHTIGLNNQPNLGSQSPSYTIWNDSVDATYQMVASRIDTLGITFQADAAVECTQTWKTNQPSPLAASVTGGNVPESTQHLMPAWNCSASIGAPSLGVPVASVSVVENFSMDIKRGTQQIYALGSESAVSNFQGPLDVTGKFSLIVQQGELYWADAIKRYPQTMTFALQDPFTGFNVYFQMSFVQLENPVINQGKAWVSLDCDYFAVGNTTDAVTSVTTADYSSLKTISYVAQSTAF